jgi:hypothetical protein
MAPAQPAYFAITNHWTDNESLSHVDFHICIHIEDFRWHKPAALHRMMHIWNGSKERGMASILPLPPGVVGEFVGRAHVDLARVQELLAGYPTLINASWDWGNGDYETALGAASHSGRKDIVDFLLSRGARIDIFSAAFLGKLSLVRAILHETPGALHLPGPHGLSLMEHAKKGGHGEMIAYLQHLIDPHKDKNARAAKAAKKAPAKVNKAKRRRAA